jgi:RNA recognition motif-containing protein
LGNRIHCDSGGIFTFNIQRGEIQMNIYVGNLSYTVTEDDLRQAFEAYGQVTSASIIKDKFSGQSKGFGFVEMPSQEEARAAVTAMNGKEMKGRNLSVNEARPRSDDRRQGGGGGGGRRGGRSSRY